MLRTKMVCTLGPTSSSPEVIEALVAAGLNVARMNMSHGSHETHARNIDLVREAARVAGRPVAVLADLAGPKIRVGDLPGPVELTRGDRVVLVPDGVDLIPAPEISPGSAVDWPDFQRFVSAIDTTLADESVPLLLKLKRTLFWLNLAEQSRFDAISGSRLDEFLKVVTQAAEQSVTDEAAAPPSKTGRMLFRMLVAQYARNDTSVDLNSGLMNRWRLLSTAVRFALGRGNVPPLQNVFRPIPFATIEQPFGQPSEQAEEMLTRYFRVKTKGLQFCGRAFFDIGLVEGFRSLVLVYPSILWLARWLAAGDKRTRIETDDVAQTIAIADHYHAYTPAFGTRAFRRRVRILTQLGDIEKLGDWYSR